MSDSYRTTRAFDIPRQPPVHTDIAGLVAELRLTGLIELASLLETLAAEVERLKAQQAEGAPVARPMRTAPKDGTMLRLLVQFNECSFDDSNDPCWVCGFNLGDNTGEDKWQFPGWSWVHDYILEASDDGTPIGWLPMLDTHPAAGGERVPLKQDEIDQIRARWDNSIHGDRVRFIVRETEAAHHIGIAATSDEGGGA